MNTARFADIIMRTETDCDYLMDGNVHKVVTSMRRKKRDIFRPSILSVHAFSPGKNPF